MNGNILTMKTPKTGVTITVEIPESLMTRIAACPTSEAIFIANENGRRFTKKNFGNWFRLRCTEAHIDKSAHGIRKLSATLATEDGAPAHALIAQYGWSNVVQTPKSLKKSLCVKPSTM